MIAENLTTHGHTPKAFHTVAQGQRRSRATLGNETGSPKPNGDLEMGIVIEPPFVKPLPGFVVVWTGNLQCSTPSG